MKVATTWSEYIKLRQFQENLENAFDSFLIASNLSPTFRRRYDIGSFIGFASNKLTIETDIGMFVIDDELRIWEFDKKTFEYNLIHCDT